MAEPKRKARAKPTDEERAAAIEREGLAAHEARVAHGARLAARTRKVQLNLRVWPEERDALAEEARAKGYTLNGWATGLIFNAREQSTLLITQQVLGEAAHTFELLLSDAHALKPSGEYRRAVSKLMLLLKPLMDSGQPIVGREREAIDDVIREINVCERALEIEASGRFRSLRTDGEAGGRKAP